MRCKSLLVCLMTIPLLNAALPASAQATYSAYEMRPRFSVGAGFSGFSQDWGHNPTVYGTTLWVDYHPPLFPDFLSGLSLEVQARDLQWNRQTYPANTIPSLAGRPALPRTDTIGGGLIYHVRPQGYYRFEPYVKALWSFGSIDFTLPNPNYSHDTRTVTSLGGGLDWHVKQRVTVRGDFEYQFWPDFLGATLNPAGFSGGVLYNFSFRRRH
jgi:hypothetical protein